MSDTKYTVYWKKDTRNYLYINKPKLYEEANREPYSAYIMYYMGTPFEEYDTQVLDHLRKDPTSIMIMIHDWSPCGSPPTSNLYLEKIEAIVKFTNLLPEQYYLITMDTIEAESIKHALVERGIHINFIGRNSLLIDETIVYDKPLKAPKKLFSIFCRASREWRFHFFCDMIKYGLLDKSIYSYMKASPYPEDPHPTEISEIKKMIPLKYRLLPKIRNEINTWVDNMPYTLVENIYDYYSPILFDAISNSHIHIVLETMVIGQIHHVTEKTWKAISVKKPFIIYGVLGSLQWLHTRGYKTFHPYINEDYDLEQDPIRRKDMIIREMTRISNLADDELAQLIENCTPTIEHNHKLFLESRNFKWPEEFAKLGIFK